MSEHITDDGRPPPLSRPEEDGIPLERGGWFRRRYEVWVVYKTARGNVHSERLLKRCWFPWTAYDAVDQREHSVAVGGFVAGMIVSNPDTAIIPFYEVRKDGEKVC